MKRALLYLWSAPVGLVGLLVEVLFRALGWKVALGSWPARGIVVAGPLSRWMRERGWAAVTIGWSVFYWTWPTEQTERHEAQHVEQCLRWGPLFPLAYLVCLALYGYQRNPFEVAARKASGGE